MTVTLIICAVTFSAMILSILFFPKIKIGKLSLDSYWIITLFGAILLFILGEGDLSEVFSKMTANSAVNPLKILALFLSMTIMSVFLDEQGFFERLAYLTLKKAGICRLKLFVLLYLIVSVLTIFTSNDIVVLSFTPFICYFCKSAKLNPTPYLIAEFFASNTWSMLFIIGNPTNIYLSTANGINFLDYFKVMAVPTVICGIFSFLLLLIFSKNELKSPLIKDELINVKETVIKDKVNLIIGVSCLAVCTLCLAICAYFDIEMWIISVVSLFVMLIAVTVSNIIRKKHHDATVNSIKHAPWEIIPFILSMFCIILVMENKGITLKISEFLSPAPTEFGYGISSFLSANVINNIPMSVLFSEVIQNVSETLRLKAVFATVIGSNLGALLTPVGALAGIMWNSILTKHGIKFSYLKFFGYGVTVALPSLAVAVATLSLFV